MASGPPSIPPAEGSGTRSAAGLVPEQALLEEARRYLTTLRKRRGLLVACVVLTLLAAAVYNYTARPLYRASAQLLIDPWTPTVLPDRQGLQFQWGNAYLNAQLQLLRGSRLAKNVVERLALHQNPGFLAGLSSSPWERVRGWLVGAPAPEPARDGAALSSAIGVFRSRVSVEPTANSSLVDVRFVAYDAEVAAAAVNSLAEAFVEQFATLRDTSSVEATNWLSKRLAEQRQNVERAERALQQREEALGLSNLDERRSLLNQKLTTLHGAAMAARAERITKETVFNEIQELTPEELEAHPLILRDELLRSLRAGLEELKQERRRRSQVLGGKHPEMVRLESDVEAARQDLEAETQKVVRSVESSYRTALRQEQRLQADLEPVQRELQELKRKGVEQGVLKREAEANQQLLSSLMQRSVETGVEAELKATPVEIVERAEVPTTPFSPRRGRNYQLALLAGLALGLALVYVVEQMDRSIKTPEEVKEQLGLVFLGMIPDVTTGRSKAASPLILETPRSSLAEAYRVVRTNLLFSSPDSTSRRLVVTSVHPGEGKSTTVTNLAVSLALNGSRVLVIDADLRRPVLDKHFGLSKTPGLSDLIVGECGPAEAIRRTKHDGLSVIPCGSVAPNPAELLGSARMRDLLDGFPDTYDWILLDAPPVFAIADAPVLSASMDGLLLVVAAERTTKPALRRAIDQIVGVGGKILGVVLNRLDVERNDYYGHPYSNYYHGYYRQDGSPQEDEPRAPERRDAPVISD